MKKILKKSELWREGDEFDKSLMLLRLHGEFHAEDSWVREKLIEMFNRHSRDDIEIIRAAGIYKDSSYLLLLTSEMIQRDPASAFWAIASDPRPEIQSLASYHAHRFMISAFEQKSGSVFAFDGLKKKCSEARKLLREKDIEIDRLRQELTRKDREIKKLESEKEKTAGMKHELRKLRYALGKNIHAVSKPPEVNKEIPALEKTSTEERIISIDTTPPCLSEHRNCCNKKKQGQCSLENLRILLVGGLDRREKEYRDVFKSLGAAKFYFHTGRCEGSGARQLKSVVEGSDVVIYLTRINSHGALSVIKGVCKKSGKSFFAVRETGPTKIPQVVLNRMNTELGCNTQKHEKNM